MIKDTKKLAFPSFEFVQSYGQMMAVGGMTLRDYFAAKAMQGLVAADTQFTMGSVGIAELAFNQADAMLKAREA
jgi:hypothetical protein